MTQLVILSKGEIVADTPTKNLHEQFSGVKSVFVEFENKVTKSMLTKILGISKVEQKQGGWLLSSSTADPRADISRFSHENNLVILTLQLEEKSLSSVFKDLTN